VQQLPRQGVAGGAVCRVRAHKRARSLGGGLAPRRVAARVRLLQRCARGAS
jgi:hypothetical protein